MITPDASAPPPLPPKLTIRQTISAALGEKAKLQADVEDALGKIGLLEADNGRLVTELAESQRCNSELTSQLGALTLERDQARGRITELEGSAKTVAAQAAEEIALMGFPASQLPDQDPDAAENTPAALRKQYAELPSSEARADFYRKHSELMFG